MDIVKILIDASRAAVGVPAAAYALSAMGLNLQFGYTGLLNFGHVASMLVGAYGMALRGASYREILGHYYRGAVIERLSGKGL